MIPYTTPTIELTVRGVDLTAVDTYVSIEQGDTQLTITDADVSYENGATVISVTLTQAQTAAFKRGSCDVQVNWVDGGGKRYATLVQSINIGAQLLTEVV